MREIKLKAEWRGNIFEIESINFVHRLVHVSGKGCPLSLSDVNLIQFTGLKNRNGVDIYEGDIIEWIDLTFPVTVENYHGYRFMFGKDQLCRDHAVNGDVIGNIYENPELLNSDK